MLGDARLSTYIHGNLPQPSRVDGLVGVVSQLFKPVDRIFSCAGSPRSAKHVPYRVGCGRHVE